MNVVPESFSDLNVVEQTRKQINRLIEEIARLADQNLGTADYYREVLQRVQQAVGATASAVWVFTLQGHLQLQFQINLRQIGMENDEAIRQSHHDLLRQTASKGQPMIMPPNSSGQSEENGGSSGNLTDYVLLLVPIIVEKQVTGLIEVWQNPQRPLITLKGFLQFLAVVADLTAAYLRNLRLRQVTGQQQLWTQLEAFARQIHASLNPTEVSYLVANEGRRLVECDRMSIGHRFGRRTIVEAISGADVVERRSNLVQLMQALFDKVLTWNETLVYTGSRDDSLPPDVLKALDAYLAESNSKTLIVLPLRDEREKDKQKPCRSVTMMECFEPNLAAEQLTSRLEVVGKHAASALYNSLEHRRIPFRWIWLPIAKVQEGLGGKARATVIGISIALAALMLAMVFVPYPLKMDAKGNLLPHERVMVFPPSEGHVESFDVDPGVDVFSDQPLVLMFDNELALKLVNLDKEIEAAAREIQAADARRAAAQGNPQEQNTISAEKDKQVQVRFLKLEQRKQLRAQTNADQARPGFFRIKSPMTGTVLSSDFRENLTGKYVRQSDPLLRIGNKNGPWEIELKIPQKHIGQILQAFTRPGQELDVDLLLLSAPTRTFQGKLSRDKIAGEAVPNREGIEEAEPVVLATVRIEPVGNDIPANLRIPRGLLVTGTEVHAKVRCSNRAMGYSLFYGVWEFLYEKVIFPFFF